MHTKFLRKQIHSWGQGGLGEWAIKGQWFAARRRLAKLQHHLPDVPAGQQMFALMAEQCTQARWPGNAPKPQGQAMPPDHMWALCAGNTTQDHLPTAQSGRGGAPAASKMLAGALMRSALWCPPQTVSTAGSKTGTSNGSKL